MRLIAKPVAGEFAPYASMYIDLMPDDKQVLKHLAEAVDVMHRLIRGFSAQALIEPCAEGEWTIKEILMHVIDTERIFAYRALRIARNDQTALAGFNQEDYVPYSGANDLDIEHILDEYRTVRNATLSLFQNLPEEAINRIGTASNHPVSVRALVYQIAGHERLHVESIRENYG